MEGNSVSYPTVTPGAPGLLSRTLLLRTTRRKGVSELGKGCSSVEVPFSAPDNFNIRERENKSFLQHREKMQPKNGGVGKVQGKFLQHWDIPFSPKINCPCFLGNKYYRVDAGNTLFQSI